MGILRITATVVGWANRVLISIPAFFALFMTVLITVNVVLRYALGKPMDFEYETVQIMLLAFVWLAQPHVFARKRDISADFFVSRFSPKVQAGLKIASYIVSICYFGVIAKVGWQMTMESFQSNVRSIYTSHFPIGPQQLMLPVGAGLLCIQLVIMLCRSLASLRGLRDTTEGGGGQSPPSQH